MNKHIQIRNFDDKAHSRLADKAAVNGMSLSEYLRRELIELAEKKLTQREFYALLRTRKPVHLNPSAEEIIREERDRLG